MTINQALRQPEAEALMGAVDRENLDDPANFHDGVPAAIRVAMADVPPDAEGRLGL